MSMASDALDQARRAFEQGDMARARAFAESALRGDPASARAVALLANSANALKDFPAAAAALERLRAMQPGDRALQAAHALALNNSGSVRFRDGDLDGAATMYRRALEIDPDHRLALANLAACEARTREHAVAARCFARLARLEKGNVAAALGHSRALRALGDEPAADEALGDAERRATTVAERRDVGLEYLRIGNAADAAAFFAADADADEAALTAIAQRQAVCNDIAGSRSNYTALAQRTAARGDDRSRFRAERNSAVLLPAVAADANTLNRARADYASAIGQLVDRWPPPRLRAGGVTLDDLACSRFLLAYQGGDDRALATGYGDWLAAASSALNAGPAPSVRPRTRRIGLVSARWNLGTIASYFGSWVGALRADGLEVFLFSTGTREDATSMALAAQASRSERLPQALAEAAARLRQAELDLLIYPEIGLDARTEVLAALRLAPRQWAAWGHPVTTGLPTIDRFISVAAMEPPRAAEHYREPLALLPGLGTRFLRPLRERNATRAETGLPDGPLYALPHALTKLHPDSDALLVAIARRDPDARFLWMSDEIPALTQAYRRRIETALLGAGLNATRHCITLPRMPIDAYRRMLACVDVVLDSLYFSGGNTSLDALAQAIPVVTVEGRFMRGRQSAAMLRLLDAPVTIARDLDDAATIATDLAHSPDTRVKLAQRIEANGSALFDREEPLDALRQFVDAANPSAHTAPR